VGPGTACSQESEKATGWPIRTAPPLQPVGPVAAALLRGIFLPLGNHKLAGTSNESVDSLASSGLRGSALKA
jgi:hypothetical protein